MAIDLRSKQGIAIVAGIAVVMLALGFGTAYLVSRSAVSAAEERARLAEEQAALEAAAEPSTTVPAVESTDSVEPTTPPTTGVAPSDVTDGVFFTFIEKVTVTDGVSYLTADYAQFLTGDAAAAAATAAGDESPPPNDYYIVNENEKLRTLSVANSVDTVILTTFEEHVGTEGYLVGFAEWRDMINGVTSDFPRATMVPYWVTIKGGKVTKIAEQYLP